MEPLEPQVLVLAAPWPIRALLRAALREQALHAVGAEDWASALSWAHDERTRLTIVYLPGLRGAAVGLEGLRRALKGRPLWVVGSPRDSPFLPQGAEVRWFPLPLLLERLVEEVKRFFAEELP